MKTKNFYLLLIIAMIGFLFLAEKGNAATFPNPDPILFGDDLEDTGIFISSNPVFSIELFDTGVSSFSDTFGFFFEGTDVTDTANLFTIFDPTDKGPILQTALIDFSTGQILDFDAGVIQDTFTPSLNNNIGFFLTPDPNRGVPTLFTVPSLNLGNVDVAGTFPVLGLTGNDDFLLGFFPGLDPIAFGAVGGLTASIQVAIDIDPKHCPNKFKIKNDDDSSSDDGSSDDKSSDDGKKKKKKKGKLKVAILGTQFFDVRTIDVTTLSINGVVPVKSKFKDVTSPSALEPCDCEKLPKDTYEDLELKFNSQDISDTLGTVQDGDEIQLMLTGNLLESAGGTAIKGTDCILIKIKKHGHRHNHWKGKDDDDSSDDGKKKKKKKKKKVKNK